MSLNQCQFIGNLGRDVEVRTFSSGDKVANFSIAMTEKWTDKSSGEKKERTEWVNVAAFGPLAGVCEKYLRKGSKVFISGKMQTRKWQDQSGADKYTTEIILQGPQALMQMLDGKPDGGQSQGYDQSPPARDDMSDSIPF